MYIVPSYSIVKIFLHFIYPRDLQHAGCVPESCYYSTKGRCSAMQWKCVRPATPVLAAGAAPGTMLREGRVSAMGNGEDSLGSQPTLQGTLGWPSVY